MLCYVMLFIINLLYTHKKNNNKKLFLISGKNIKNEGKKGNKKTRQRPTLAQALQALPLATQRLTAEFGMGSGRTTASGSPG